jgi:two-component system chemotaxis sensor kinase CheA
MDECKDVELIDSFVAESQDMLDEVETVFIELRGIPIGSVNPDTVNAVFRLYHSMKGSAAFLGLNNIAAITHKAETLLNLVRDGHGIPDESFVDVQLVTLDAIREILAHIQTEKTDDGFEATRESVVTQLDAAIAKMTGTVRNSDEDHYVPSRAPANPTETKASECRRDSPPFRSYFGGIHGAGRPG